jgi:hypothetical protein
MALSYWQSSYTFTSKIIKLCRISLHRINIFFKQAFQLIISWILRFSRFSSSSIPVLMIWYYFLLDYIYIIFEIVSNYEKLQSYTTLPFYHKVNISFDTSNNGGNTIFVWVANVQSKICYSLFYSCMYFWNLCASSA